MRPSEVFAQHRDTIRQLVTEHGMTNPRLFGSVLHGDDIDGSDLDILVDAGPRTTFFEVMGLKLVLEDLLGLKVDVRTPGGLHPRYRSIVTAEARSV
jgi:uncharacterized protein